MKRNILITLLLLLSGICANAREAVYVEYKITSSQMSGTSITYTSNGDSRTEMVMNGANMPMAMTNISLLLQSAPGKVYVLNDKDKTYNEVDAAKSGETGNNEEYEITLLGKEKINDYNCVHVKIVYQKSHHTSEMWLSKDVRGYGSFTTVKNKYMGGTKFFEALKAKGAEGFVVRMLIATGRGGNMQMDLVKAEKKDVSESLFSYSGYTKSAMPAGMPGGMEQPNMEKLKNMTPEERKAYIEEMKAKYAQPH